LPVGIYSGAPSLPVFPLRAKFCFPRSGFAAPAEQRSTIPGFSPRTHENRITDGLVLDICGVGDRRTAARPIKMLKPGAQGRVPLK